MHFTYAKQGSDRLISGYTPKESITEEEQKDHLIKIQYFFYSSEAASQEANHVYAYRLGVEKRKDS